MFFFFQRLKGCSKFQSRVALHNKMFNRIYNKNLFYFMLHTSQPRLGMNRCSKSSSVRGSWNEIMKGWCEVFLLWRFVNKWMKQIKHQ